MVLGYHHFWKHPYTNLSESPTRWWSFKYVWKFHPDPWGCMRQFDKHSFQMGWFNHQVANWATKNPLTFNYTGCLIRILILFFYNPYINWVVKSPIYPNQPGLFFIAQVFIYFFVWRIQIPPLIQSTNTTGSWKIWKSSTSSQVGKFPWFRALLGAWRRRKGIYNLLVEGQFDRFEHQKRKQKRFNLWFAWHFQGPWHFVRWSYCFDIHLGWWKTPIFHQGFIHLRPRIVTCLGRVIVSVLAGRKQLTSLLVACGKGGGNRDVSGRGDDSTWGKHVVSWLFKEGIVI